MASEMMAVLSQPGMRQNLRALAKYVVALCVTIAIHSVLFHVLMEYEGQTHSWLTGVYWTLTVMSTLGFGDITFHTDLGRLFSIVVLVTGVILLLIVLPFAFIRYFYAPWLEAQTRLSAPREVPEGTRDHVIFFGHDDIAEGMIQRLDVIGTPYVVIEADPAKAVALHARGMKVLNGAPDDADTFVAARAPGARLAIGNLDDPSNANAILTFREVAPTVRAAVIAEDKDAVDILELAGANQVLPLKQRLGEHLAGRVTSGTLAAHVVGRFGDLLIAEIPVHGTPLQGKTVRDTRLREQTGASIVAYWEKGHVQTARPNDALGDYSVVVVAATTAQLDAINASLSTSWPNENAVLVIGGGKVGRAVVRALKARGVAVHVIEEDTSLEGLLREMADGVFIGDAADINVMTAAGIRTTPSVVLTTHDDATNVYLAVYCRKLNPNCRIVSRIMHDRNLEAIHRAGAEFVLGETALGVKFLLSVLERRELIIAGENVDIFFVPVPEALQNVRLADSGIGAKTGLSVVGLRKDGEVRSSLTAATLLEPDMELLVFGSNDQRQEFTRTFSSA